MDDSIGVILKTLEDLHLTDSTLVYFSSDHGGTLQAYGADGQRTGGFNGPFKGLL